jgi:hypothetical protein
MLPNIGATEIVVVLLVLAILVASIWAIVDAAIRPEKQWIAVGQNKVLWVVLLAGGMVLCTPIGSILAVAYLMIIRPRLESAAGPH